jgi:hypothetical protein
MRLCRRESLPFVVIDAQSTAGDRTGSPHREPIVQDRDEVYDVVVGQGEFVRGGTRVAFTTGDVPLPRTAKE